MQEGSHVPSMGMILQMIGARFLSEALSR
jgi:hypothetical protein